MRILMTESDARVGADVEAVLAAAGHEVVRCTDGTNATFPCSGVAGGVCPLDEGVAVAVSAPGTTRPAPSGGDVGLICALRQHVPFLVASPDRLADLPAEVERMATAPLPQHTQVVQAEARRILGDDADATVVRDGTALRVTLDVPDGTERRLVESAAVRAKGAIRRMDRWATVVDVNVG